MTAHPRPPYRRLLRRRLLLSAILGACLALGACAFGAPPPDQSGAPPNLPPVTPSFSPGQASGDPSSISVIASHLTAPWGIAFLPDGTALVTERIAGKILHVGPPATASGLTVTTVATVTGVSGTGDGGLLGIAVSPRYADDHTVYVYYSTRTDNRVGSVTLAVPTTDDSTGSAAPGTPAPNSTAPGTPAPNSTAPGTPAPSPAAPIALTAHPILTGIPRGATDNGGGLAFGPDHLLYASTGDTGHPSISRSRTGLGGKILRMTAAGRPAPGRTSLIYAYGLHDVDGFAWDSDRRMYAMDAGRTVDALYQIVAGADYGWSATSTAPGGTPLQTWPLAQSTCPDVAVLQNLVVTTCLDGARVWVMQLTAKGTPFGAPTAALSGTYGRLRTVVLAPDGSLWLTTSNTDGHGDPGPSDDRILKLVLSGAGAGIT